jgi:hypothetical protein
MSRTNMALLMRVLLTASQVLTVDSKIANVEANIFNFLAVDGFQVAGTALVLAPWYHFQASFFADRGWFLCSGALTVGGLPRSHVDVQICVLTSWIQVGLGSRPLVGPGSSTCTRGTCCFRCGAWDDRRQCPSSASERLPSTLCVRVGSPLWTMERIIVGHHLSVGEGVLYNLSVCIWSAPV